MRAMAIKHCFLIVWRIILTLQTLRQVVVMPVAAADDLGAKRSMGRGDKKEVGDGLRRG
jgi:hypothetical protein